MIIVVVVVAHGQVQCCFFGCAFGAFGKQCFFDHRGRKALEKAPWS
jgi:hypothetical protein